MKRFDEDKILSALYEVMTDEKLEAEIYIKKNGKNILYDDDNIDLKNKDFSIAMKNKNGNEIIASRSIVSNTINIIGKNRSTFFNFEIKDAKSLLSSCFSKFKDGIKSIPAFCNSFFSSCFLKIQRDLKDLKEMRDINKGHIFWGEHNFEALIDIVYNSSLSNERTIKFLAENISQDDYFFPLMQELKDNDLEDYEGKIYIAFNSDGAFLTHYPIQNYSEVLEEALKSISPEDLKDESTQEEILRLEREAEKEEPVFYLDFDKKQLKSIIQNSTELIQFRDNLIKNGSIFNLEKEFDISSSLYSDIIPELEKEGFQDINLMSGHIFRNHECIYQVGRYEDKEWRGIDFSEDTKQMIQDLKSFLTEERRLSNG